MIPEVAGGILPAGLKEPRNRWKEANAPGRAGRGRYTGKKGG